MVTSVARLRRVALALTVLGVLLAGVGVLVVVARDDPSRRSPSPAATRGFLAAWERSRETTWFLSGTFERSLDGGQTLADAWVRVQRPPDRLSVAFGSVTGRRADTVIACGSSDTGDVACREAPASRSYDDEVRRELDQLRALVTAGPDTFPLYGVSRAGDDCFVLSLLFPSYPGPPYGEEATFCFDPGTGAPSRSVIERAEGVDRQVAVEILAVVTDADLDPATYVAIDDG